MHGMRSWIDFWSTGGSYGKTKDAQEGEEIAHLRHPHDIGANRKHLYVSAQARKVLNPGDEGWKRVVALQILGWVETVAWILIIGAAVISSIAGQWR
jgi:hypothetical protein